MKNNKKNEIASTAKPSSEAIVTRKFEVKSNEMSWQIICPECPLLEHTRALKVEPIACISGLYTNMQGAIPMKTCAHYLLNSIDKDKKTLKCKR